MRVSSRGITGWVMALLVLGAMVATPVSAGPFEQRVVSVASTFIPADTTIAEGEALEFTNLEPVPHNLIALRPGPDGQPAFRTDTIGAATTVPVVGVEDLEAGVYDYVCTLHPGMVGTIYVNSD